MNKYAEATLLILRALYILNNKKPVPERLFFLFITRMVTNEPLRAKMLESIKPLVDSGKVFSFEDTYWPGECP